MNAKWVALAAALFGTQVGNGGDWPQWRGPNRDAKAADFKTPKTWPEKLTEKWKTAVGNGVSTPALVGDKLFVFSRQDDNEIIRCLNAETGKEVWADKSPAAGVGGPARDFPGPRSSSAIADGKVVTLGVHGKLSCYDAASGKMLWRKDNTGGEPGFAVSSSPLIVEGLCIIQFGGDRGGGIMALDLSNGNEKWKWTGEGAAYASPSLAKVDDKQVVVAETTASIVAVGLTDGKQIWSTPFVRPGGGKGGGGAKGGPPKGGGKGGGGGGMSYNASSPVVDGDMIIYGAAPRGTKAVSIEKKGDTLETRILWNNPDTTVQFNSPVVKNGFIYGLTSDDKLFCLNAKTGKTEWDQKVKGWQRPGYGSVVDVGSALMSLTPAGELIVYEATDKQFKQIAKYSVGKDTFAYPIATGNRIYIKDGDSVTCYLVE